jgi:hypothetical protein
MADNSYSVSVVLKGTNQLSTPVNQAQQSLKGLSQEAGRTNQAMSQLKTVGMGLFAGASLAGVARMAEELYTSGMEAQRAGNLFRSFGAQVGDTDALLARLRTTTRGVVTDIDLMNAASSMMSMGLAKNATDVERLTNIGVTFAQAMGTDVASSLENLNMILANQSYLRLDTLGISSSDVRTLAGQYRAAGMDSSEAFNAAFMDVAEGKLPQMSAIADATVTEFQKLQTSMDNFWTTFGERFAQGVNGLIGIAEAGGIAIQAALFGDVFGQATARGQGDAALSDIAKAMAAQGGGLQNWSNIRQIMAGALNAGVQPGQLTTEQLRALFPNTPTDGPVMDEAMRLAARGMLIYQQELSGIQVGSRGAAGDYLYGANSPYRTDIGYSTPVVSRTPQWYDQLTASGQLGFGINQQDPRDVYAQQRQMRDWLMEQAGVGLGRAQMGYGAGFERSGITLFSQEDLANAQAGLSAIEAMIARAEEWNSASGRELVSDDQLAIMEGMRQNAAGWADEVQRGVDAVNSMNLSQRFGQTSGGARQEMYNSILAGMQANGTSQDQIDAFAQQFGQDSGAITGMSAQWDNTVVPAMAQLGDQLGYDAVIAWMDAYYAAQDEAIAQNYTGPLALDLITQAAGQTLTSGSFAGGGETYTVKPGDTASAIAAQFGVPVSALGLSNPSLIMPGQNINIGGGAGGLQFGWDQSMIGNAGDVQAATDDRAQQMGDSYQYNLERGFEGAVDTFGAALEELATTTVKVPVEFVITNGGLLGQLIAAVVNANGGTVPGSSANGGRSGAGTRGSANDGNRTRGR